VFGETLSSAVDPGPGPEWRFNAQPVPGPSIDPTLLLGQGFTSYEPLLPTTTDDIPTLGRDASPQPTLPSINHQIPSSGSSFTSRVTTTLSSSPTSPVIRGQVRLSSSNYSPVKSSISPVGTPATTTSPDGIARAVASPFAEPEPIDPDPRPQLQKCIFCDKDFPSRPPSARWSLRRAISSSYYCDKLITAVCGF